MSKHTSLKQAFQGMIPDNAGIISGKVVSASPLKVQAVNDDKLVLGASVLRVPRHLTDYEVEVTVDWATKSADSHKHDIDGKKKLIIHNALQEGDMVYMFAFNHGKKYYILDREG